jgi:hypothetical protein
LSGWWRYPEVVAPVFRYLRGGAGLMACLFCYLGLALWFRRGILVARDLTVDWEF